MWISTLALILVLVLAGGADARSRRHARTDDPDRPATRAEVAVALLPVIDAQRTKDGRQMGAEDVARLEDVSIHISDEMAGTETRVARLQAELASLRAELDALKRHHRHFR